MDSRTAKKQQNKPLSNNKHKIRKKKFKYGQSEKMKQAQAHVCLQLTPTLTSSSAGNSQVHCKNWLLCASWSILDLLPSFSFCWLTSIKHALLTRPGHMHESPTRNHLQSLSSPFFFKLISCVLETLTASKRLIWFVLFGLFCLVCLYGWFVWFGLVCLVWFVWFGLLGLTCLVWLVWFGLLGLVCLCGLVWVGLVCSLPSSFKGWKWYLNSKLFCRFFCWRLLGLIPGGTPFSQLNKGVRDAMSATTKRDVKHQVFAKTCKGPQVPTKSKQKAKNAESREGTKKRAPVKCNQRKRALVKPEGSTYAGARSARERQEGAKFWTNCKGWWPLKEVFIRKPNLRQIRSARKTLKQFQSRRWNVWNVKLHPPQIPLSLSWLGEAKTA